MRGKNNKGFTLIEIIAVIVILGILSIMVVPRIYDLFDDSRKNIYIEDAIRLISEAQFTMNSKSMKIDKPENGECIVFSMKYLSTNGFQNPPNGGLYLSESSFVLVKNVNGSYVYSTMLVEKTKDDIYMGVELTTEKALNEKDALKHVRTFKVSEIGYFDDGEWSEGSLIDSSFVNGNVSVANGENAADWDIDDGDIIGYYNNERGEDAAVVDTASPRITTKFSTSGALETVLTVSAKDEDTDLDKLKVCIKVSKNKNDSYPSATDSALCEGYGNNNQYEKRINFADYGFSYETRSTAYVFILVVDDTNNMTRKRVSYDVHENEPPKITDFTISKLENDKKNMPKAQVKLSVSDDMTSVGELQICFAQDNEDAETCTPYSKYASLFGSSGTYNYTFKNSSGAAITKPDGSTHSLKVFVKDEKGLIDTAIKDYTIYNNEEPELKLGEFTTSCLFNEDGKCACKSPNCNSLTVMVNLEASDDLTEAEDLILTFYQLKNGSTKFGEVTMTYSQFMSGDRKYTFSGKYDGEDRELFVEVKDQYGKTKTESMTLRNVYSDLPAEIVLLNDDDNKPVPFITSAEYACSGADSCRDLSNGGSYHVNLNFDVKDDLTDTDDIKVCVSEDPDYCGDEKEKNSHFKKYADFDKEFEFSTDLPEDKKYPTDQVVKELYVAIKDSQNHYTAYNNLEGIEYKVYHNSPPIISGNYEIISSDEDSRHSVDEEGNPVEGYEGGLTNVVININNIEVVDDFTEYTARFCYAIDDGDDICTSEGDLSSLRDTVGSEFSFKDEDGKVLLHKGQKLTTYIEIKDNYGSTKKSKKLVYDVYNDKSPNIVSSSMKSVAEEYNSYYINVSFKVLDYQDNYEVCVTENDSCDDSEYMKNSVGSEVCEEVDTDGDGVPDEDSECIVDPDETVTGEELFEGTYGTEYELTIDGSEKFDWSDEYKNDQPNKHLKLFVKDSYGNVTSTDLKNNGSTTYSLYELCSNPDYRVETDDPPTFDYVSGTEISPAGCEGACYRSYKTTDNKDHVNFETGSTEIDGKPIVGVYKKTLKYEDTLVGITCDGMTENTELRCDNVRCFNTGSEENPNVISLKLEDENSTWYYSNSRVTKEIELAKPYCENLGENDYFHPGDIRCNEVESVCSSKVATKCKPYIDKYEQEVAAYELEEAEYVAQQLIYEITHNVAYDGQDYEDDINTCMPLLPNLGLDLEDLDEDGTPDNGWSGPMLNYCQDVKDCKKCKDGTAPADFDCTAFEDENGEIKCEYVSGSYRDKICTALGSIDMCKNLYNTFSTLIQGYKTAYEKLYARPTPDTCEAVQTEICKSTYAFCDKPFTEVYKEVTCEADHDLDVTCRRSAYDDGYCLNSDTTCTETDSDCVEVCYKHYDCKDKKISRPVTFTCHGYFPTYRSIKDENNNIILKKTPIRICPDFYFGFFDQMYAYEESTTPYIRFNPEEIELDPALSAISGGTGD